jgi:hypothetical protein
LDQSWYVRYSFVEKCISFIHQSTEKSLFISPLLDLTGSNVSQIRSLAIHSMSKCCKDFPLESLIGIDSVFDSGMRARQEEIRSSTIDLWAALLEAFPEAPFHEKIEGTLNLIGTVPIEAMTFRILTKVVPLMGKGTVPWKTLNSGLMRLVRSYSPQSRVCAIELMRKYVHIPHLREFAIAVARGLFEMVKHPAFCVRCAVGEFFVDFTMELGWDWLNENIFCILKKDVKEGATIVKQSLMRTVLAFLCVDPPVEVRMFFVNWMKEVSKSDDENMRANAELCKRHLPNIEELCVA